jgi:hypothetical protein
MKEQPKFTTVEQVIEYLKQVDAKIKNLQKKYPELTVMAKDIKDLPIDLIFDIFEYMYKEEIEKGKSVSSYNKVTHLGDYLSLSGYSFKLPCYVTFKSVKVKPITSPIAEREKFVEAETV